MRTRRKRTRLARARMRIGRRGVGEGRVTAHAARAKAGEKGSPALLLHPIPPGCAPHLRLAAAARASRSRQSGPSCQTSEVG
eukprot:545072-Pyramimonas_sp.AAC.1